jgi:hypothetical protein
VIGAMRVCSQRREVWCRDTAGPLPRSPTLRRQGKGERWEKQVTLAVGYNAGRGRT